MRHVLVILPLLSLACGLGTAPEIQGAWISNRDLTLASIAEAPGITTEDLELYSDPNLFGHMVHIWGERRGLAIFDGKCWPPVAYARIGRGPDHIDLLLWGPAWLQVEHKRVRLIEGGLALPILDGRAQEILTPIDPSPVRDTYPCLQDHLTELGLDAA
jgi:hypothetical protein